MSDQRVIVSKALFFIIATILLILGLLLSFLSYAPASHIDTCLAGPGYLCRASFSQGFLSTTDTLTFRIGQFTGATLYDVTVYIIPTTQSPGSSQNITIGEVGAFPSNAFIQNLSTINPPTIIKAERTFTRGTLWIKYSFAPNTTTFTSNIASFDVELDTWRPFISQIGGMSYVFILAAVILYFYIYSKRPKRSGTKT